MERCWRGGLIEEFFTGWRWQDRITNIYEQYSKGIEWTPRQGGPNMSCDKPLGVNILPILLTSLLNELLDVNTNHFMQTCMTYIKCFYELYERFDRFRWKFQTYKEAQVNSASRSRCVERKNICFYNGIKFNLNLKMDIKSLIDSKIAIIEEIILVNWMSCRILCTM